MFKVIPLVDNLQLLSLSLYRKSKQTILDLVEVYENDKEEGFTLFIKFIKNVKKPLSQIIQTYTHPGSVGLISPRLLRDPLYFENIDYELSAEERNSHIFAYLKAVLLLVTAGSLGIEPWKFQSTAIYDKSLQIKTIKELPLFIQNISVIISTIEIQETIQCNEPNFSEIPMRWIEEEEKSSSESEITSVPFTARLTAYHRFLETKTEEPLVVDPYAEELAGDLTSFIEQNPFSSQRIDYAIVRTHYIEEVLLTQWCKNHIHSQIVMLGAGLDTRAYRVKSLEKSNYTIFEVDLSPIISYKETILSKERPLCKLRRIIGDLRNDQWIKALIKEGYDENIPTFWIVEGLVYYLEKERVEQLLIETNKISSDRSEIFLDVCVPALAELKFGSFTRYFKWGIDFKNVAKLFETTDWKIEWSYADKHNQGRDVGQRGMIFIHGSK